MKVTQLVHKGDNNYYGKCNGEWIDLVKLDRGPIETVWTTYKIVRGEVVWIPIYKLEVI